MPAQTETVSCDSFRTAPISASSPMRRIPGLTLSRQGDTMWRFLVLAAGLTALLASAASAQELDPRLYPKWEFDGSATLLLLSENIRVDPKNQPGEGTEINAEDVLGVSGTSLQPRL